MLRPRDLAARAAELRKVLADPATPRRHRWLVAGLLAYLASPIDLIPDFIPVLGYLDDVLLIWLVLRVVRRPAAN